MQWQPGFFDVEQRAAKLTEMGDPLVGLGQAFRPDLNRVNEKVRTSNAGAKPFDVVLMFKVLVRTMGWKRAKVKIGILDLVYNVTCLVQLLKRDVRALARSLLTFLSIALLLCAFAITTAVNAQTTSTRSAEKKSATAVKNAPVKQETFMERYYAVKAAYPALTSVYGDYSASSNSQEKFMERYNQIKGAYPKLTDAFGNYAASEYSLADFIKRYYQIKDSYPRLKDTYGDYAGSKKTLEDFIKRYYQIKDSSPALSAVYAQYAASDNDLTEFSARYYAIKASSKEMKDCYGDYAASTKKLSAK